LINAGLRSRFASSFAWAAAGSSPPLPLIFILRGAYMELSKEEQAQLKQQLEQEKIEAAKVYETGRTRLCNGCKKTFPLTPNNFHRDADDEFGYKALCKKCRLTAAKARDDRRLVNNANSLKRDADEILDAATSFLQVTSSAAAKNSVPHLAELYEQMMWAFGGSEGMASKYRETFERAPEGGSVRKGILDTIMKTGEKVSEMGVAQVPTELIADDDLSKEVQSRLKLILGKDAHLVDYLMGNKDSGAVEQGPDMGDDPLAEENG
jgi:hypothetical protein